MYSAQHQPQPSTMEQAKRTSMQGQNDEPAKDPIYAEIEAWFTEARLERFAACLGKAPFLWRVDHLTCKNTSIRGLAYKKLMEALGEPASGNHCVPRALALCRVFISLLQQQLQWAANETQARGTEPGEALGLCPPWARHADSYLQLMPDVLSRLQPPNHQASTEVQTNIERACTVDKIDNSDKENEANIADVSTALYSNNCNSVTETNTTTISTEPYVDDVDGDQETEIDTDLRKYATYIMDALTVPPDIDFYSDQEAESNADLRKQNVEIVSIASHVDKVSSDQENEANVDSVSTGSHATSGNSNNLIEPNVENVCIAAHVDKASCDQENEANVDSVSTASHADSNNENDPNVENVSIAPQQVSSDQENEANIDSVSTESYATGGNSNNENEASVDITAPLGINDSNDKENEAIIENASTAPYASATIDNSDKEIEAIVDDVSAVPPATNDIIEKENEEIVESMLTVLCTNDNIEGENECHESLSTAIDPLLLAASDGEDVPACKQSVTQLCHALLRRWLDLQEETKLRLRSHIRHHSHPSEDEVIPVDLSDEESEADEQSNTKDMVIDDVCHERRDDISNHEDGNSKCESNITIKETNYTVVGLSGNKVEASVECDESERSRTKDLTVSNEVSKHNADDENRSEICDDKKSKSAIKEKDIMSGDEPKAHIGQDQGLVQQYLSENAVTIVSVPEQKTGNEDLSKYINVGKCKKTIHAITEKSADTVMSGDKLQVDVRRNSSKFMHASQSKVVYDVPERESVPANLVKNNKSKSAVDFIVKENKICSKTRKVRSRKERCELLSQSSLKHVVSDDRNFKIAIELITKNTAILRLSDGVRTDGQAVVQQNHSEDIVIDDVPKQTSDENSTELVFREKIINTSRDEVEVDVEVTQNDFAQRGHSNDMTVFDAPYQMLEKFGVDDDDGKSKTVVFNANIDRYSDPGSITEDVKEGVVEVYLTVANPEPKVVKEQYPIEDDPLDPGSNIYEEQYLDKNTPDIIDKHQVNDDAPIPQSNIFENIDVDEHFPSPRTDILSTCQINEDTSNTESNILKELQKVDISNIVMMVDFDSNEKNANMDNDNVNQNEISNDVSSIKHNSNNLNQSREKNVEKTVCKYIPKNTNNRSKNITKRYHESTNMETYNRILNSKRRKSCESDGENLVLDNSYAFNDEHDSSKVTENKKLMKAKTSSDDVNEGNKNHYNSINITPTNRQQSNESVDENFTIDHDNAVCDKNDFSGSSENNNSTINTNPMNINEVEESDNGYSADVNKSHHSSCINSSAGLYDLEVNVEGGAFDPKLLMDPVVVIKRFTSRIWDELFTRHPRPPPLQPPTANYNSPSPRSSTPRYESPSPLKTTPSPPYAPAPKSVQKKRAWKKLSKSKEVLMKNDGASRVAKRVELPDIEEVRRNNRNMLTAQVTPITQRQTHSSHSSSEGQSSAALSSNSNLIPDTTRPELGEVLTQTSDNLQLLLCDGIDAVSCGHDESPNKRNSSAAVPSSPESCTAQELASPESCTAQELASPESCTAQELASPPDHSGGGKQRRNAAARARSFITSFAKKRRRRKNVYTKQQMKCKPVKFGEKSNCRKRKRRGRRRFASDPPDDSSALNEEVPSSRESITLENEQESSIKSITNITSSPATDDSSNLEEHVQKTHENAQKTTHNFNLVAHNESVPSSIAASDQNEGLPTGGLTVSQNDKNKKKYDDAPSRIYEALPKKDLITNQNDQRKVISVTPAKSKKMPRQCNRKWRGRPRLSSSDVFSESVTTPDLVTRSISPPDDVSSVLDDSVPTQGVITFENEQETTPDLNSVVNFGLGSSNDIPSDQNENVPTRDLALGQSERESITSSLKRAHFTTSPPDAPRSILKDSVLKSNLIAIQNRQAKNTSIKTVKFTVSQSERQTRTSRLKRVHFKIPPDAAPSVQKDIVPKYKLIVIKKQQENNTPVKPVKLAVMPQCRKRKRQGGVLDNILSFLDQGVSPDRKIKARIPIFNVIKPSTSRDDAPSILHKDAHNRGLIVIQNKSDTGKQVTFAPSASDDSDSDNFTYGDDTAPSVPNESAFSKSDLTTVQNERIARIAAVAPDNRSLLKKAVLATQDDVVKALSERRNSAECRLVEPISSISPETEERKQLKDTSNFGFKPLLYRRGGSVRESSVSNTAIPTGDFPTAPEQEISTDFSDSEVNEVEYLETVEDAGSWTDSGIAKNRSPTILPLTKENVANLNHARVEPIPETWNSNAVGCINEEFVEEFNEPDSHEAMVPPDGFYPVIVSVQSLAPQQEQTNNKNLQSLAAESIVQSNQPTITLKRTMPIYSMYLTDPSNNGQVCMPDHPTDPEEGTEYLPKVVNEPSITHRPLAQTFHQNSVQSISGVSGSTNKSSLPIITLKRLKPGHAPYQKNFSSENQVSSSNSPVGPQKVTQNLPKVSRRLPSHTNQEVSQTTHVLDKPTTTNLRFIPIPHSNPKPSLKSSNASQATTVPMKSTDHLSKVICVSRGKHPSQQIDRTVETHGPQKTVQLSSLPKITLNRAQPVYASYQNSTCDTEVSMLRSPAEEVQEETPLPRVVEVTGNIHIMQPQDQMGLHLVVSQESTDNSLPNNLNDIAEISNGDVAKRISMERRASLSVPMVVRSVQSAPCEAMKTSEKVMTKIQKVIPPSSALKLVEDLFAINIYGSDSKKENKGGVETMVSRRSLSTPSASWARDREADELAVLCVGPAVWATRGARPYLLVSERAAPPPVFALWTLRPRQGLQLPDSACYSEDSPARKTVDGVVYQKMSNDPDTYAKLLVAVIDARACRELLVQGAALQMYCLETCQLYPLHTTVLDDPPRFILTGDAAVKDALMALKRELAQLGPASAPATASSCSPAPAGSRPSTSTDTAPATAAAPACSPAPAGSRPSTSTDTAPATATASSCSPAPAGSRPSTSTDTAPAPAAAPACSPAPAGSRPSTSTDTAPATAAAPACSPAPAGSRPSTSTDTAPATAAASACSPAPAGSRPSTCTDTAPAPADSRPSTPSTLTASSRPSTPSTLTAPSPVISPVPSPAASPAPSTRDSRPASLESPTSSPYQQQEFDPLSDDAQPSRPRGLAELAEAESCPEAVAILRHMADDRFLATYRLPRMRVLALVRELRPLLPPLEPGDIDPTTKVLICLNFLGSGCDPERVVPGAPRAAACAGVAQVVAALTHDAVYGNYVRFPETARERADVKRRFYEELRVPGVLGALDGVHVPIMPPDEDDQEYFNGVFHSLNVQLICDADLKILNVDAGHGGAAHDCGIWLYHQLNYHLKFLRRKRGERVCFLGDSGYPQEESMLTPIEAPKSSADKLYNATHKRAHSTIGRCIAALQARWRCLSRSSETTAATPALAAQLVAACAALHNMTNLPADVEFEDTERRVAAEVEAMQGTAERYLTATPARGGAALERGRAARDAVVRQLEREALYGRVSARASVAPAVAAPAPDMSRLLERLQRGRLHRARLIHHLTSDDVVVLDDDSD